MQDLGHALRPTNPGPALPEPSPLMSCTPSSPVLCVPLTLTPKTTTTTSSRIYPIAKAFQAGGRTPPKGRCLVHYVRPVEPVGPETSIAHCMSTSPSSKKIWGTAPGWSRSGQLRPGARGIGVSSGCRAIRTPAFWPRRVVMRSDDGLW